MRQAINEWLSIIIKVGAIGLIVLGALWFCTSIFANVFEVDYGMPDYPPADKARYQVLLKTTGWVYLTNEYEQVDDGVYRLHGFYELDRRKWEWHDSVVTLDEQYFGDIIIERRTDG